jgi:hypothetical protein
MRRGASVRRSVWATRIHSTRVHPQHEFQHVSQVPYLPECFPSGSKKQILFQKHCSLKSTCKVRPTNVKHTLPSLLLPAPLLLPLRRCCCSCAFVAAPVLSLVSPRHRWCPLAIAGVPAPSLMSPRHRWCPRAIAGVPAPSLVSPRHRWCPRAIAGVPVLSLVSPRHRCCSCAVATVPAP